MYISALETFIYMFFGVKRLLFHIYVSEMFCFGYYIIYLFELWLIFHISVSNIVFIVLLQMTLLNYLFYSSISIHLIIYLHYLIFFSLNM